MATGMTKQIHVKYFALLREQRGQEAEVLQTQAGTSRDLYNELKSAHGFSLDSKQMGVAINDEFSTWETQLKSGDRVVFLPPVAGG